MPVKCNTFKSSVMYAFAAVCVVLFVLVVASADIHDEHILKYNIGLSIGV